MQHRDEIDGLRAIAVSTVLVFHFFPALLPLGYLGVDLFFVISGFLISTYILEEVEKASFSFKTFYWRRARRILPATLVLLLVTSFFAFFILTPPDLVRYSQSLIATLTFTANIFFWRTGGYFGDADELKPLLHMWSLGVEEQFYLLFPAIFVLIVSKLKTLRYAVICVLLIVLLSFLLNVFLAGIGGENPAFFLLPTRVWQFGVGTLAAFAFKARKTDRNVYVTYASLLAVMAGLLFAVPVLPMATTVTLGLGVFLSRPHHASSLPMQCLTHPLVRRIGLISFSLYLWHWPVLVFMKYVAIEPPPLSTLLLGMVVTLILASASYTLVEAPYRWRRSPRNVSTAVISSMLLMIVFVGGSVASQGFKTRHSRLVNTLASATQTNYRCPITDYFAYGNARACFVNKDERSDYDIALIGNSHAQMYVPALEDVLKGQREKGILIPLNSCLPTIDVNVSRKCLELARMNYAEYIKDDRIKTVIFAMTWYSDSLVDEQGRIREDRSRMLLARSVLGLMDKVESAGKEVFLVGPIKIPGRDLSSSLSRELMLRGAGVDAVMEALKVPRGVFDTEFGEMLTFLSASLGTHFVTAHDRLCRGGYCYYGDKTGMFFADASHLSASGARLMAPVFRRIVAARVALGTWPR
ncbi:acyltransferase family protein [Modicisalibacter coralii]|uniref:acyltransferase family protein n=1 Tax=Modicisalibacter coralii TaxID=2304602 RepID=UPI00100B73E2|nr:acyltransferase family protein [Halomonas coralii]